MIGLNNGNTQKILPHDKKLQCRGLMEQVFPKSNRGQSTWRGREAGKRAIKGGEEQPRKGFRELERESICKNERERERERERGN